jgi:hypothetical protein
MKYLTNFGNTKPSSKFTPPRLAHVFQHQFLIAWLPRKYAKFTSHGFNFLGPQALLPVCTSI